MKMILTLATILLLLSCNSNQKVEDKTEVISQVDPTYSEPVPTKQIEEKKELILKTAEHPKAQSLKKVQWGKQAKFEDLDKDLCKVVKESTLKGIFKTQNVGPCKTITGENTDARMYMSSFTAYEQKYDLSILFARAPNGFESEIMYTKGDKVNYTENLKLADGRVKAFSGYNNLRVFVNASLRINITVSLNAPKVREEPAGFSKQIEQLANVLIRDLK